MPCTTNPCMNGGMCDTITGVCDCSTTNFYGVLCESKFKTVRVKAFGIFLLFCNVSVFVCLVGCFSVSFFVFILFCLFVCLVFLLLFCYLFRLFLNLFQWMHNLVHRDDPTTKALAAEVHIDRPDSGNMGMGEDHGAFLPSLCSTPPPPSEEKNI